MGAKTKNGAIVSLPIKWDSGGKARANALLLPPSQYAALIADLEWGKGQAAAAGVPHVLPAPSSDLRWDGNRVKQ